MVVFPPPWQLLFWWLSPTYWPNNLAWPFRLAGEYLPVSYLLTVERFGGVFKSSGITQKNKKKEEEGDTKQRETHIKNKTCNKI